MLCFYFFNLAFEALSYSVLTSNVEGTENHSSRKHNDNIYSSRILVDAHILLLVPATPLMIAVLKRKRISSEFQKLEQLTSYF